MKTWVSRLAGIGLGITASASIFAAQGCLDRPVVPIVPGGSGVKVTKIRVTRVDKVDLLLVVDNSLSMADKQSELGRRMPQLIKALTNPDKDPKTGKYKTTPVADLHVGVISSSLGSQGTSACDPSVTNKHNNDHGHLMPRDGEVPTGKLGWTISTDTQDPPDAADCPSGVAVASALTWAFDPVKTPGTNFSGESGSTQMQAATACVVAAVKEDGCGYEESWEAAYHFLIDPAPYVTAEVKCTFGVSGDACGNNKITVTGVDSELVAQRNAFLRKDSLLAVLFLTDENDFSLKPASLNWLPWGYGAGQMQRGWAGCDKVPDDFEPETAAEYGDLHTKYNCFSCFENASDANCKVPWAKDKLNNDIDGRNMRGWHMTQRFGYNFLWGRQRYVDGFSKAVAAGSDGKTAVNPIFAGGFRSTDLVIVAGIVGVPKILVEDASGPKLLTDADWSKITGPVGTRDPHMVESIAPRTDLGIKKFAGDRAIDDVNGGDRDITDGDDLQFACIAKRATDEKASDCDGPNPETKSPLCGAGGTQPYFKAYPGLRHLRIIKDLGASGFVASICNNTYAPAIKGIVDKLQAALNAQCLRAVINQDATTGNVNCLIIESFTADTVGGKAKCEDVGKGYCTPGAEPCRQTDTPDHPSSYPPISPDAAAAQLNLKIQVIQKDGTALDEKVQAVAEGGNVYATGSDGKKHLVCEMVQLAGGRVPAAETNACLTDPKYGDPSLGGTLPSLGGGWCYTKDTALVGEACIKNGAPGKIRFFGDTNPKNGSEVFTLCVDTGS
jgi:hypothetical protein